VPVPGGGRNDKQEARRISESRKQHTSGTCHHKMVISIYKNTYLYAILYMRCTMYIATAVMHMSMPLQIKEHLALSISL
jgi:hypothetical protein